MGIMCSVLRFKSQHWLNLLQTFAALVWAGYIFSLKALAHRHRAKDEPAKDLIYMVHCCV